MQGLGNQLFTGTTFPRDQSRGRRRCQAIDQFTQGHHGLAEPQYGAAARWG